ncbi:MAG: hypothetical protein ABSD42_10530 [Candidatus Bathyarchaeia archaeon]|jgi:hypothetical protein
MSKPGNTIRDKRPERTAPRPPEEPAYEIKEVYGDEDTPVPSTMDMLLGSDLDKNIACSRFATNNRIKAKQSGVKVLDEGSIVLDLNGKKKPADATPLHKPKAYSNESFVHQRLKIEDITMRLVFPAFRQVEQLISESKSDAQAQAIMTEFNKQIDICKQHAASYFEKVKSSFVR